MELQELYNKLSEKRKQLQTMPKDTNDAIVLAYEINDLEIKIEAAEAVNN